MIRPAKKSDARQIAAIWNPIIRDTVVTFTDAQKSPEAIVAMLAEKAAAGHAFLVAEIAGRVAGFATFGQFRAGPGYRHTFEHSIILAPAARGRGLGRGLIATVETAAREAGGHGLFGGVSADNPEGLAFHAAVGFSEVARLPEVGFKFGRWLDLVLVHKCLTARDDALTAAPPGDMVGTCRSGHA
jgi:L-amino acid N-acyltransferase